MGFEEAYNKYIDYDNVIDWSWVVKVKFDGEEVYEWNDDNRTECPEDLCWSRLISEVFRKGFELGYRAKEIEHER